MNETAKMKTVSSSSRDVMKVIKCLVLLLFVAAIISLQSFNYRAQERNASATETIAKGEKLFGGTCSNAYCHGSGGRGGGAPSLRNREFTADYLARVISNGIPGTNMPAFKNRFSGEQIAQLANYVLSLSPGKANATASAGNNAETPEHFSGRSEKTNGTATTTTVTPVAKSSALLADEAAGREVFFRAIEGCHVCHSYNGKGGKVASDLLGRLSGKSNQEIIESFHAPKAAAGKSYEYLAVTTNDGQRVVGIKRDEGEDSLRIYDTSSLPPVSRSILKSKITGREKLDLATVHASLPNKYSEQDLRQLLAFLNSAAQSSTPNTGSK